MSAAPRKLTLKTPHLGLFVARRNSGKTTLMRHLLYTLARGQKFRWVTVISPTAFNGEWTSIVGDQSVLPTFDEDYIADLMEEQAGLRDSGTDNPGLLILDDCLGAANFQSEVFTRLASAGRHYQISLWISTQHFFKLPPVLRTNADYMFVLGVQNERVARALWEEFGGLSFDTWKALQAFAATATRDFGALCVNNTDARSPVSVVRAPSKQPAFKIRQG